MLDRALTKDAIWFLKRSFTLLIPDTTLGHIDIQLAINMVEHCMVELLCMGWEKVIERERQREGKRERERGREGGEGEREKRGRGRIEKERDR